MAALTCSYVRTGIVIPPATPTTINVGINNAAQWTCVLKNSGANPVTAITLSTSPLGLLFEAPFAVEQDLPLAAGASFPGIRGCGEPVLYLQLIITSALGTTVDINAAGV